MLKHRVIPVVQVLKDSVVKTVSFENPRQVGDATSTVRVFSSRSADELVLLDIGASLERREPDYQLIAHAARQCFMPLTIGGGISSFDVAKKVFDAGADKILIGSLLHFDPSEVKRISRSYGAQAIVVSLDFILDGSDYYSAFFSGSKKSFTLVDAIEHVNGLGIGEVMITSIQSEGRMCGYDFNLLQEVTKLTAMPVILNGGAGKLEHFASALQQGASAVAASSVFFWEGLTINEIRRFLKGQGIAVTN